MSKIGIVGDLHFGIKNNNENFLKFQIDWFYKELIPKLKEEKCDTIVFLGDVFDNRVSISPLILTSVRKLFKDICKSFITHVVVGNHDCYYRNTNDVHSLEVLEDQGAFVYPEITEIELFNKKCLILPWLTKNTLEKAEKILTKNNYDLCFGHLEVNGFEMAKNHIKTNGMTQDTFFNCRKVYSGHFHIRNVDGQIKYVGTPYELYWGDYLEEKGFTILDTNTMEETYFLNETSPKHIKIKSKDLNIKDLDIELIKKNHIELEFHEGISESDRIILSEKIDALQPMSYSAKEEKLHGNKEEDIELTENIKNKLDSLFDYAKLIGCPEGLEMDMTISKIKEIYEKCDS